MEIPSHPISTDITQSLERHISQLTGGRVFQLRAEWKQGHLIVSGLAPTYYVKQLTIRAVLELLGPRPAVPLELNIVVGPSNSRAPEGQSESRC